MQKKRMEMLLLSLEQAIQATDRDSSNQLARQANQLAYEYLPKNIFDKTLDFLGALLFALCVAIVVRQTCLEFYIIPSGSMRPTLKEKDYLVVSKSAFGVNTLGRTSHYYFDPSLLKRGNIIVFSGDKMEIPNADTTYFLLFPGKKQYVKRLVGKPGDILYFYGGKLYGFDKDGEEIQDFNKPWFEKIEHVPFIRFEGNFPNNSPIPSQFLYQFNEPIISLTPTPSGELREELFPFPSSLVKNSSLIKHYYELWGFQNFATSCIISEKDAQPYHPKERSSYYLLLMHHPDTHRAKLRNDVLEKSDALLSTSTSLIPLSDKHLEKILEHITTSRFVVKNKKAVRIDSHGIIDSPLLDVPDGAYEFFNGAAYSIYPLGISFRLSSSHPLYRKDPKQIAILYNFGIRWNYQAEIVLNPSRYAYFRNGDLFLMGNPILLKEELSSFVLQEKEKASLSTSYHPFIDQKPPLAPDGKLDKEFINKYGLVIPPGKYLALGDNHPMSSDCRDFGFVPQANIRGKAFWIFWPLSHFGKIAQPSTRFLALPHLIVWGGFIFISIGSFAFYRRYLNKPLKF